MSLFISNKLHAVAPVLALTIGAFAGSLTAGDMTITAGKLARDAKDYYGKTVTVKAEVENVYDSRSFTLDEDSVFAGPDVLVLVPSGMTDGLTNDTKVIVTGVVRQYVVSELERDFDWFKNGKLVTTQKEIDFKMRPVLVATSLMVDGREMMMGRSMSTSDRRVHDAKMAGHKDHKMEGDKAHKMDHKDHGTMSGKHGMMLTAGKLARDGKKYYGKTVTVKAEVEDVLDAHSFTLDEDSVFAGPDVLVLVPSGMTHGLTNDTKVMVTGVVRQYVVSELERDFDWFKNGKLVTTKTDVDFKMRPVLVASSLMVDGRQMMTGGSMSMTDRHVHDAKMAGNKDYNKDHKMDHKDHGTMSGKHGMMLTAGKLARDGKKYYGQNVTVRAEVEDVLDAHSFTLDEDSLISGADVVVLVPAGLDTSALAHDQVVVVTGKVRPYVSAELDKDYDWFKNGKIMTTNREMEFKERPVLVAETITTADGRTLIRRR